MGNGSRYKLSLSGITVSRWSYVLHKIIIIIHLVLLLLLWRWWPSSKGDLAQIQSFFVYLLFIHLLNIQRNNLAGERKSRIRPPKTNDGHSLIVKLVKEPWKCGFVGKWGEVSNIKKVFADLFSLWWIEFDKKSQVFRLMMVFLHPV